MKSGSEKIVPYSEEERKGTQIQRMFDKIALTYDKLNHILSFGIDKWWRRKCVRYLAQYEPTEILDIASGTGDLTISMAKKLKPKEVIGADISEGMMNVGREKAAKAGLPAVSFEYQDCMALTYEEKRFDAVTAAFGVRNFENLEQGLSEMYRVLKPGGHIAILEFSSPAHFPMKQLYSFYSRRVIPFVGGLFSIDKQAYDYLPASIEVMRQGQEMVDLLSQCGFKEAAVRPMTFGICSLYTGTK